MGPVQLNETKTIVKAIKKMPVNPPLSACWSALFTIQLGKTISNAPKKEAAKITKIKKKKILGNQCVDNQLAAAGPAITATKVPIITYIPIILNP